MSNGHNLLLSPLLTKNNKKINEINRKNGKLYYGEVRTQIWPSKFVLTISDMVSSASGLANNVVSITAALLTRMSTGPI